MKMRFCLSKKRPGNGDKPRMCFRRQCRDSAFEARKRFVQPFFAPPTEEMMEIDQEPLLATSSDAHELETMVATYELADAFTTVAIPIEETDAKRLSSAMRVLHDEKSMLIQTPITEQALTQSVTKPDTVCTREAVLYAT